jgi:plastocyanin
MINKNMFLVIAIFALIGSTTSLFQFNTVEAQLNNTVETQSNNPSSSVNQTAMEPTFTVTVKNFAFEPSILTVPNGAKIIFDFQNGIHTVKTTNAQNADPITINNGGGNADAIPAGETREVTINGEPGGVIEYQCGIHGAFMSGTIRIEEAAMEGGESDMLVIALEDWGGLFPLHVDRIYNSYSGVLTDASSTIDRISIDKSDSQIQDLKGNITANNYFGLDNKYGDPSDCCDIIHHTMSISMGKKDGGQDSKTVFWNDGADFPGALSKIANLFRNLQ